MERYCRKLYTLINISPLNMSGVYCIKIHSSQQCFVCCLFYLVDYGVMAVHCKSALKTPPYIYLWEVTTDIPFYFKGLCLHR